MKYLILLVLLSSCGSLVKDIDYSRINKLSCESICEGKDMELQGLDSEMGCICQEISD